jgi:protein-disulfide isomerase
MRTRLFLASLSPVFALGITATAHAVSFAPVNPAVDHILGNPAPKVMIVEYIDLEDEASKQHHATVKALSERYKNKVNWVIRHLPSAEHQNAQKEAEAAECINELGDTRTMWTFIQEVFDATASGGRGLQLSKLTTLAGELGLSKLEFEKCLSSGRYASFVKGQAEQARQGGITTAPVTFLVLGSNGKWQMIAGAGTLSAYTDVINAMLYDIWSPPAATQPSAPAPLPVAEEHTASPDGPLPPVDPATDHIRGKANAPVTVIEYTDFECPFCIRHQKTMSQLLRKYRGSVNWVTRPFPLPFHAGAEAKAVAAECVASLKGNNAFWRFHDQIFKRSGADGSNLFPVEKLASLARNVGVSPQKLDECMDKGEQPEVC